MTKLFYSDKPIFGLDISNSGIKIMSTNPEKWLVEAYGALDLDPKKVRESFENGSDYLQENIKLLLKEKVVGTLPSNHVAVSIPTSRTYSRTFSLPIKLAGKINDAVELEADQYIPIPTSSLYIDHQIIDRNKKEVIVLMSAVAKNIVDHCVEAVQNAGLTVSIIEPGVSAVSRLLTHTEEGDLPTVIVDIGATTTDIAILDGGSVRVSGGIATGGNTFTLDISKKLGVSLKDAHDLKIMNGLSAGPKQSKLKPALEPALKRIISETQKVIRYYNERINEDKKFEQLLVVGSGSNVPGIGDYFTDAMYMPARVASPWQKLNFGELAKPAKEQRSKFITSAGLSIINPASIWI